MLLMHDFLNQLNPNFELLGGMYDRPITHDAFCNRVRALSELISNSFAPGTLIGLHADNSPAWLIADLAIQNAGMFAVPIPNFFSADQVRHVIQTNPIDALLADYPIPKLAGKEVKEIKNSEETLRLYRLHPSSEKDKRLKGFGKLTFTSGSTGAPKGINLSTKAQWTVAKSLARTLESLEPNCHLSLLPLPVLLENVAGAYTSLAFGSRLIIPPLQAVGLRGSSEFSARAAIKIIEETCPETIILLPQMLRTLVADLKRNKSELSSLKFVAVGGGKVPLTLIHEARGLGLPVYEGYGLTEAVSVVSLNTPRDDRVGTVGRPLPHQPIKISESGEILIQAPENSDSCCPSWLATGDLGHFDQDGFLSVTGRLKNVIITGFGRNISPEWPESLLLQHAEILQVMVYGEGEPHLSALIVPSSNTVSNKDFGIIVDSVNSSLPDYAHIKKWQLAAEPFSSRNGDLTSNGRLRRDVIAARYL